MFPSLNEASKLFLSYTVSTLQKYLFLFNYSMSFRVLHTQIHEASHCDDRNPRLEVPLEGEPGFELPASCGCHQTAHSVSTKVSCEWRITGIYRHQQRRTICCTTHYNVAACALPDCVWWSKEIWTQKANFSFERSDDYDDNNYRVLGVRCSLKYAIIDNLPVWTGRWKAICLLWIVTMIMMMRGTLKSWDSSISCFALPTRREPGQWLQLPLCTLL